MAPCTQVDALVPLFGLDTLSIARDPVKFYSIKRKYVLHLDILCVSPITNLRFTYANANESSSYYELREVPPLSDIQRIIDHLRQNSENCNAAIFYGKLFFLHDIESIIRIHSLKLLKANVIKEVEWLSLQNHSNLKYPTNRIVIDVTFINRFRDMLLRGKVLLCVDRHFPYLLYSDLANLVGNKWMNLALIAAFTTMINESQTYNRVITINTIYDMHDYDMMNMLKGWKEEGVISCSVVLNVRNKAGSHRNSA